MTGENGEYRYWRIDQQEGGIVRLTIDRYDSGANSLSSEVLEELDRLLTGLSGTTARAVVFRSGKKKGFIAGADIREFTGLKDESAALQFIRRGQEILSRIEVLKLPTFALIHGFCLGGGLELALACRYRIASDNPATILGFPEVKLGLHPGFGGTLRSTRLVGPLAGMKLMLTGQSLNADQALKIGLVDVVVPEKQLDQAMLGILAAPPPPRQLPLRERLAELPSAKPGVAKRLRHTAARKADSRHYPAPSAMIDLWSGFGSDDHANYTAEAESIARLMVGSSARNLIRVFLLQERLKGLGRSAAKAPETVHVVGCGAMGADIAAWCALQGLRVTFQDQDSQLLSQVFKRASVLFWRHLKDQKAVEAAIARLVPDSDRHGIARADLVIEAIYENADDKAELYRQLEQRMRPDAILASTSTGITLEELSGSLTRPERLLGLHFFNPPDRMQLVEVVTLAGTDPGLVARARAFVLAIKRLPLPVASSSGLLVSRILMPYLLEAITLVEEGFAPGEVDLAVIDFGMPMGPLRLADSVGLDNCLALAGTMSRCFSMELPLRLEKLVASGHLGRKSGKGFYRYDNPGEPRKGSCRSRPATEIGERIMLRLLNEAVACWRERLVEDADLLDAGVVFGSGFAPFRGGPLQHIRSVGPATLLERLAELSQRYGNRFAPDPGWQDLIDQQRKTLPGGKP